MDEEEAAYQREWIRQQLEKAEMINDEVLSDYSIKHFDVCRKVETRKEIKKEMYDKLFQPYHFFREECVRRGLKPPFDRDDEELEQESGWIEVGDSDE